MSSIRCPYCQHAMELKGAKPGRYHPRCMSCHEKFALIISEDFEQAPEVHPLHRKQAEELPTFIETALGLEPPAEAKPRVAQTVAPTAAPRSASVGATLAPPSTRGNGEPASAGGNPTRIAPDPHPDDVSPTLPPEATPRQQIGITAPPPDLPTESEPQRDEPPQAHHGLETTGTLGGYQLLRKLGEGGMGAVYLAKQLSLNRNVALKVLLEQLAADAQFVARFIREAYAAAQLTHHNVVQIHDIGAQKRTHFFSMEFVEGQNLSSIIREQGRLDPEVAVGYVLQAARGLKFAHDHNMIHRDIKPENLLLNRHGIVKVADLGLVKTADGEHLTMAAAAKQAAAEGRWYDDDNTTQLNVSMGTPAYMPPEQARDAAHVDARADIYALGCTLYALVVGRPPFTGKTAIEVITKHLKEPVRPPDQLVEHVPAYLSQIILKMMAKRPEDRYRDMDEVIEALEDFLGVETSGPFSAKPDQVTGIENCVAWFNNSSWAKIRRRLIQSFVPLCVLLFITALFLPVALPMKFAIASGIVGFGILTPVMYQLIVGITRQSYLFFKVRQLILGSGAASMLTWTSAVIATIALLVLLDMHWPWLFAAIAAVVAAAGFHFAVDPMVESDRRPPIERAEALLKQARRTAVSEAALQQFVCKYAGENWEEFYEAIFGYESKIMARERWGHKVEAIGRGGKGDRGRGRPRFAAWRDPIIAWIDARQRARKEARDRRLLEKIERESLKARGFPETAARKKARYLAETIVVKAAELRESAAAKAMEVVEKPAPAPPSEGEQPEQEKTEAQKREEELEQRRQKQRKGVLDEEGLEGWEHLSYFQRRYGGWAGLFLGPAVRFALGALLLAGCIMWAKQNELLPTQESAAFVTGEVHRSIDETSGTVNAAGGSNEAAAVSQTPRRETKPLELELLPRLVRDWFNNWNAGIAGLLLIISAFFSGPKLGLFVVPAGLIAVAGPETFPQIAAMPPEGVSLIFAGALAAAGFQFARN